MLTAAPTAYTVGRWS
ncbi:hypothetical protein ECPA3_0409, partial [Escherichia coli PA3]